MKLRKRLFALLLAISMLSLTACGLNLSKFIPGGNKGDYKELEKLLDKGQYDAAITYIENMKEDAAAGPKVEVDSDDFTANFVKKIAGTYKKASTYAEYEVITINEDVTATIDGKTYTITIDSDEPNEVENYLSIREVTADGDKYVTGLSVKILDNGLISVGNGDYVDFDAAWEVADEEFKKLVGVYETTTDYSQYKNAEITADHVVILDGQSYDLIPYYDT